MLNTMNTYACSKGYTIPHVDRIFVMCNHNFFNEKWGDQLGPYSPQCAPGETLNVTGKRPADYTTSLI
eukprot:gene16153-847_t